MSNKYQNKKYDVYYIIIKSLFTCLSQSAVYTYLPIERHIFIPHRSNEIQTTRNTSAEAGMCYCISTVYAEHKPVSYKHEHEYNSKIARYHFVPV